VTETITVSSSLAEFQEALANTMSIMTSNLPRKSLLRISADLAVDVDTFLFEHMIVKSVFSDAGVLQLEKDFVDGICSGWLCSVYSKPANLFRR
jgi:RINT-1 / TIP-1 family